MSTTSDRYQADRATRARTVAAVCTANLLAHLVPLGENRRLKLSGLARAADIRAHGISAGFAPVIPPCPHCARHTRRPEGHRPGCLTRTAAEPEPCDHCGRRTRKILGHTRDCIVRQGYGE
ncbi:hypothetical protein [Streptomyces violaceusniger]|uniref:Uncharacterized protein n=1 Tax=Streptomyces violaceusniger (strain Tu 4113) TaxID=653045 RepID=G2PHW2_STRV4|nr:hypothetical protein [Streptomyces violaceusniger]AEM88913.1 hypothetical protein Strvi_0138 [Streptomyces violaceusniger Tu 4113]